MTFPFGAWGVAAATCEGEVVSGDRFVLRARGDGVLIANVDGIGHGREAAQAAQAAVEVLEDAPDRPPDVLLKRCHEALRGTRGAVLIVVSYDAHDRSISWAGVGDILGVLVRADPWMRPRLEVLMPREGVAGHLLPSIPPTVLSIHDGDTLVLATDGIRDAFVESADLVGDPALLAKRILARHRKGNDDALVLVVRFHEART